ncbi:SAVED domain-containing protein [Bacillus canaveralius]|uniref:SAVED domain-containing protein n=1 Tax=Bacillus canaveralius TaxID=1403243 RepID=UPI00163A17D4|nr:SAVED domain-containing protein [Bacillus canaveralius]
MAGSIKARNLGDEYQALFFWLKVCEMISDYSNISSISFESSEIKSLDDVVIKYKEPVRDRKGQLILAEYYQVKFHMDYRGHITVDNLMDPKFINASKYSFLQKVKEAHDILNASDKLGNAMFVTPWAIHPDDELAKLKLIDALDGSFRMENLFDGKQKSNASKLRKRLREHLGITDDTHLENVLSRIRIWSNFQSIEILSRMINSQLISVGLKPFDFTQRSNPYISLLRRLFEEGKVEFFRDQLIQICKDEGLWQGNNIMLKEELPVGIRSFYRKAENMESETSSMVCLLDYFNGRYLKDEYDWNKNVKDSINNFVNRDLIEGKSYRIYLDTHSSLAFTAGHFLDPKSGVSAVPIQKGLKGRDIWRPESKTSIEIDTMWQFDQEIINQNGQNVVIIIEITHAAYADVKRYIDENQMSVKSVFRFYFKIGTSYNVIQDGFHAMQLANEISKVLNGQEKEDRIKHYHFFGSGPNGFWFFLGQLSRSFGNLSLYEHDFEITKDYMLSIQLP